MISKNQNQKRGLNLASIICFCSAFMLFSASAEGSSNSRQTYTVMFSDAPAGVNHLQLRAHIPGAQFIDLEFDHSPIRVHLAEPLYIDHDNAIYANGIPYSFIYGIKTHSKKVNGNIFASLQCMFIDGLGGPYENEFEGRLWPEVIEDETDIAVLYVTITRDHLNYTLTPTFKAPQWFTALSRNKIKSSTSMIIKTANT